MIFLTKTTTRANLVNRLHEPSGAKALSAGSRSVTSVQMRVYFKCKHTQHNRAVKPYGGHISWPVPETWVCQPLDWLPLLTGETCLCRGRREGTFVIRSHDSPPPPAADRWRSCCSSTQELKKVRQSFRKGCEIKLSYVVRALYEIPSFKIS